MNDKINMLQAITLAAFIAIILMVAIWAIIGEGEPEVMLLAFTIIFIYIYVILKN